MDEKMEQLLFAKQLMDNSEFVTEEGLRRLLEIIKSGSGSVVEGTSYAPGAFAAWKRLVTNRPDLFAGPIMTELEELAKNGRGYAQQAGSYVVKFIERPCR